MPYRILDLRFCAKRQAIDDEPLQRLLHGQRVITTSEHFYTHDGTPHLLVCVHYGLPHLDGAKPVKANQASQTGGDQREKDPEWKDILREENAALFEMLRTWRSARARTDAVPPYIVLTNAQLARIANEQPGTLEALGNVPGVGRARLEKFGKELIEVIKSGILPPQEPNHE